MFSAAADYYDLLYDSKDYGAEAQRVANTVRSQCPDALTLLDVACGTGKHAAILATEHDFQVDGIDIEPRFIELARSRAPAGAFHIADMRNFRLDRRYDAIVCLFSSIGYVKDRDGLQHAIRTMAAHLARDGVVLVEPWFEPAAAIDRHVTCLTREADEVSVCRMSYTRVEGRVSRLYFEYLIGTSGGVQHCAETHELGLFTRDEMTAAFDQAGLAVDHDPEGLTGRGLYVGRRAA
jgi:SAM-dependent methyltransferase